MKGDKMANDENTPKSDADLVPNISDIMPDVDTGELLEKISGKRVLVESVEFFTREGQDNNQYTLSVIHVVGGEVYHTGSPVIAETLERYTTEFNRWPVGMTFTRVPSKRNPRNSYWTVK